MKRVGVIVFVCLCVMALVSCKPKPPKEAKAKELVEAHFKEKGYEVKCVSLGKYNQLGEDRWSAEVEISRDDNEQVFTYEVEFKALKVGYELTCGFEYMLELDEIVNREVNSVVNKAQFSILSIGKVPKGNGAVNKNVPKSISVNVQVKYLLFDPSRVPEEDTSAQPKRQASAEVVFIPEINKLQIDFKKTTFLLTVLEPIIKEEIINSFEEELYIRIEVDSILSLNENGKDGYSGKATISLKKKKRNGTLPFDCVLAENGRCKVNCRWNNFADWLEDGGKNAKWRARRLEIIRQAWTLACDPTKLHDENYYPLDGDLLFMANNAITNKMNSTYWGDYTKLDAQEDLTYMSKAVSTQTVSFEGRQFTKTVLGNEFVKVNVDPLPPLSILFDSSSFEPSSKIDMEKWELEIARDIEQELEEKYDVRFLKDPDYLEKSYPIYKVLDRATIVVKEERGVKNVKITGMIKVIGQNKIMIGPRTILIEDLVDDSRVCFDMAYREKIFNERKFNDTMMLKTIDLLRSPMHDRRMCIKLQKAGYIPNIFKKEASLYNPNPEAWVSQHDFLAYLLRAHLIAKDLLEKEGYVYSLNVKLRLEWMPKKVAENMALFNKVRYQRFFRLAEVLKKREAERERMRRDGYSDDAIERAFKDEFGEEEAKYGRCLFCKGKGQEIQYIGGGYYKTIECRACFGTGKSSNVDGVTLDEEGNVVEDGLEFEDEEFWNSADLVATPLK